MASVQKNIGSPYWTAYLRIWIPDPTSRDGGRWQRTRRSTKVPVSEPSRTALLVAEEIERQHREAYIKPDDTEEFFKHSLERLMIAAGMRTRVKERYWQEFSSTWLANKKCADRSREKYSAEIARFTRFLGARKDSPLQQLTEQDCNQFYKHLTESGLANGTVNQTVKTVRCVLRTAQDRGLIQSNPAALVSIDTAQGHQRRAFTPLEVRQIFSHIEASEDKEWRIVCMFGLLYGLRLRDAVFRSFSEVRDGVLTFIPMKKRRKGRPVPLPLIGELASLKGTGLITPNIAKIQNLSKVFSRILTDAGIKKKFSKATGRGRKQADATFHSWRHTCNSWLANVGVDGRIRQLISDHDSPTENARYTKPDVETMRKAVDKLIKEMGK